MLDVVANSKQLNEVEIFNQLQKIMKMSESAEEKHPPVGILTSDGRTEWVQAREALIKGLSKYSNYKETLVRKVNLVAHLDPSVVQIKSTGTLWP